MKKRDNRDLIGYRYGPGQGPHIKCEVVGARENDQVLIRQGDWHYRIPAAVIWGIKESHERPVSLRRQRDRTRREERLLEQYSGEIPHAEHVPEKPPVTA